MNHPERIPDFLTHILVACNRTRTAIQGLSQERFLQLFMEQDVVIRQIEVIGEASKRIQAADSAFADANPELGLAGSIAMRNRIAHQYEGVDLELVWKVAISEIPVLRNALIPVLLQIRPEAELDSLHF